MVKKSTRKTTNQRTKKRAAKFPILNPRTARFRESLVRIAQKFDDFPTFSEYYWNGLARNTYWIGSDREDFAIKELEKQYAKEGRLIAYIHPEMIKEPYAVEVDLSYMNPLYDVTENPKDPTNSIKIIRPDLIKVRYITPVSKAIKIWEYNSRYLPSSQYELLQFWKAAQTKKEVQKPLRRRRSKIKSKRKTTLPIIKMSGT